MGSSLSLGTLSSMTQVGTARLRKQAQRTWQTLPRRKFTREDYYRLAELGAANNPSGWAGVLKVKTPDGTTFGYILLYTNP